LSSYNAGDGVYWRIVTYLFRHIINAEVVGSAAFDLPDFGKLAVGLTAFWAVEAGAAGVIGARDFSDIPLAFPAVCVFFFFVMTGCRSLPLKLDRCRKFLVKSVRYFLTSALLSRRGARLMRHTVRDSLGPAVHQLHDSTRV